MKITVTMKDPDVLHNAVLDAVEADVAALPLESEERDAVAEMRREKVLSICESWFRYGEYLTVEIDTDERTCIVVPAK